MPIRPENRARYPKDWAQISQRIRNAAGNRCQWCNAPNGQTIDRGTCGDARQPAYRTQDLTVYMPSLCADTGQPLGPDSSGDAFDRDRSVRIILTVAHLDHTPENCGDDNLRALCQRCHNRHDAPMRAADIAARRRARLAVADMFWDT